MGKKPYKPLVSVCTPTFNRRPFIETMFQCFRNQTYPKDRMEWIIVDDGTDSIADLIAKANIPQIKYFREEKRMALGEKRNYMHKRAKGSIIVYMDDDDYYPPERVAHAVERLMGDKDALCAGASEMYVYFKSGPEKYSYPLMVQLGPYGPKHATAGTFAFKSRLLDETKYDETAEFAEEKTFLKDYTIPFVQLDPMKTILVFSHNHNTYDKRKLLENSGPTLKVSDKTVDDFIRLSIESDIKQFFLHDVDALLESYSPGSPENKPGVLEKIRNAELSRSQMIQHPPQKIIMQKDGGEPVELNIHQIVGILQQQQSEIERLRKLVITLGGSP